MGDPFGVESVGTRGVQMGPPLVPAIDALPEAIARLRVTLHLIGVCFTLGANWRALRIASIGGI